MDGTSDKVNAGEAEAAEKKALKKEDKKRKIRARVWEIDFLRGFCVILMLLDHTMYDLLALPDWFENFYSSNNMTLINLSDSAYAYWYWNVRLFVRQIVVFLFLTLSGISCALSKNNPKRLARLVVVACAFNLVTFIMYRFTGVDVLIVFGIIHIMAFSLLLYMLLNRISPNKYLCLAFGIAIVIMGIFIRYWDYNSIPTVAKYNLECFVGLKDFGSDCYGVVPYCGFFLIGAFLGKVLYKEGKSRLPKVRGLWSRPLEFVGRRAIFFYVLHQPTVFLIMLIIGLSMGYKLYM